ncbi:amidohydrolase family protein [Streptomyces hyaluromycini]|uniref:Amidohydrolase family protein n=1 Tax=Streptomyces hyaluromycini TaxID=1377993 RepID=A0ABV1WZY3_9ACTN
MKAGRFIVDTHVHAQRHAAGKKVRDSVAAANEDNKGVKVNPWRQLGANMPAMETYDNSERLLWDMGNYDIDMCVLLPAFGMSDALNAELVERHPDRFVAECGATDYRKACIAGEVEWSIKGACEALDKLLATGTYRGVGEAAPYMPVLPDGADPREGMVSSDEAVRNMMAMCDVVKQYDGVIFRTHSGCAMGYELGYHFGSLGPTNYNILLVHDLATAYPEVPIVINHGGIQAHWSEIFYDQCLQVAAAHDNVYLETGLWWSELYDKAVADPNIGPEKLIFGTDWGASIGCHSQPFGQPSSYFVQDRRSGPIRHQADYWGWGLRELTRVRMAQDDMNLILGGNAARLYKLQTPFSRIFRPTYLD